MGGLLEPKVIIRGHVFEWHEKAPFVQSGKSLFGAIEYDFTNDLIKCHECGKWFTSVGGHIKLHGITSREYKTLHGLNLLTASLNSLTRKKMLSDHAKAKLAKLGSLNPLANYKSPGPGKGVHAPKHEKRNLESRCAAQLIFRIQMLAKNLGHTPHGRDLYGHKIDVHQVQRWWGSLANAMMVAGLEPNEMKPNSLKLIPADFMVNPYVKEPDLLTENDFPTGRHR